MYLASCIAPSESQGVRGENPAEELEPPPPSEMGPRVKIGHQRDGRVERMTYRTRDSAAMIVVWSKFLSR
jgi:hypothetical protein